jgi:hypothetical protein
MIRYDTMRSMASVCPVPTHSGEAAVIRTERYRDRQMTCQGWSYRLQR